MFRLRSASLSVRFPDVSRSTRLQCSFHRNIAVFRSTPLMVQLAIIYFGVFYIIQVPRIYIGFVRLETNSDIAKVSVVGAGMINNPGVAARMFEALYDAGVNINMISTSEIKISVLVDKRDGDRAVQAIHDKFFGM